MLLPGEKEEQVNEQITLIRKMDGLTFGTDAYLLASFIKPEPSGRAVELGTGTGIISLLCAAKGRFSSIQALEIQEDFANLAARNVERNGLTDRITVRQGDIRCFRAEDLGGEAAVVFANPPYMKTDSGKRNDSDYRYLARHEVCGGIGDFCRAAARLLQYGGKFYCVWRPDRLTDLMAELRTCGLEPKTMAFVHADCESEPSMALVCAKKGGASGMRVLPPLCLHDAASHGETGRALSLRAARIYDTMNFYEEGASECGTHEASAQLCKTGGG